MTKTSSDGERGAIEERLRSAAARSLAASLAAGVEAWDRSRMLPRLLPMMPQDLADTSRRGRLAVLRRLSQALRSERRRGRAGHWSYSLDRHIGLLQAITAEKRDLPPETTESPPDIPVGID